MPEAKEDEVATEQITFTLASDLAKKLDALADADPGIRRPSRHHVARKIVTDYLAKKR